MIAELGQQDLDPSRWGYKAARLSRAAGLGFLVPPGICLCSEILGAPHSEQSLSAWLHIYRPDLVALRSSSPREDLLDKSNTGSSVSIIGCPPIARTIIRRIHSEILSQAKDQDDSASDIAVIVQQQVGSGYSGVAFYSDGALVAEFSYNAPGAVTSGLEPHTHVHVTRSVASATGRPAPTRAITDALIRACRRLRESFGFDIDLEWVWDRGALFVLQVRPVTRRLGSDR
ncbi:MAG TPA: pyruvate phosphate dikinase [Chloroflexota bacterium]